jgi:hypothetical protein
MFKEDFIFLKDYENKFKKIVRSIITYSNFELSEPIWESFLVHVRNLYEFFYKYNKSDKVYAKNFITSWNIKNYDKKIDLFNIKINGYLNHLSYNRVEDKNFIEWDPLFLFNHFKLLIIKFLDELEEINKDYLIDDLISIREELRTFK